MGAEKFQKVVFFVEKSKYRIIEKFFPNIQTWYEKNLDRNFQKKIKKEPIERQRELIVEHQNQKMLFRKELVYKQNRNYHYNPNYPTRFIKYLEWNKQIHMRGIRHDILSLIGIGALTLMLGNPIPLISVILLGYSFIQLIVNFQCVNLQNYNLCRFQDEKMYSTLERLEKKQQTKNLEKLGESIVPVASTITSQIQLPTVEEIVDQITTYEQAKKLLEYAKEQYSYLEGTKEKVYTKKGK